MLQVVSKPQLAPVDTYGYDSLEGATSDAVGDFALKAALVAVAGGWVARSLSESHSWLSTLLGASAAVALYSASQSGSGV